MTKSSTAFSAFSIFHIYFYPPPQILFKFDNSDSRLSLAKSSQAEGFYAFIFLQHLLHGSSQCPRSLAVDDGDGFQLTHDGAVDIPLRRQYAFQALHAPDIQLRGHGGSAQLKGLPEYFSEKLKVNVRVSPDPVNCVAMGTARCLSMGDQLETGFCDATPRMGRR